MHLCTDIEATPAQCNGPNPDGEKPLSVCKIGLHISDDAVQVEALTCAGNLARLFWIDRDRLMTPHRHRFMSVVVIFMFCGIIVFYCYARMFVLKNWTFCLE